MDSNPVNEAKIGRIETTDDVEGHATTRVKLTDDTDVEGHGTKIRVIETPEPSDEGDDTEGHRLKGI